MDRDDWNRRYETTELLWTAEPNQFLVAEVSALTPGSALDLAAGEGRNAVWLARRGWWVTAVDFSDVALAKAEQLASAAQVDVTAVCADVTDYAAPPGAFDLVVVLYLHLPAAQRRPVHRRAARALVPAGTLLVVGHDTANLTQGYGGPQDPEVLFSPDDVVADLAGTGLMVEKAVSLSRKVTTPGGERVAIDALVRARRPTR